MDGVQAGAAITSGQGERWCRSTGWIRQEVAKDNTVVETTRALMKEAASGKRKKI